MARPRCRFRRRSRWRSLPPRTSASPSMPASTSSRSARRWTRPDATAASRGASTISQQVAKNLFLWNGRSWVRKGVEAWFTVLIEVLWPKQRILEMYLNIAEFGRGIYGAEAASQAFYRKAAARLSRRRGRAPGGGAAESDPASCRQAQHVCAAAPARDRGADGARWAARRSLPSWPAKTSPDSSVHGARRIHGKCHEQAAPHPLRRKR